MLYVHFISHAGKSQSATIRLLQLSFDPQERMGSVTPELNSSGLQYETTRLRNELRAKTKECEEKHDEITTLQNTNASKDKEVTSQPLRSASSRYMWKHNQINTICMKS